MTFGSLAALPWQYADVFREVGIFDFIISTVLSVAGSIANESGPAFHEEHNSMTDDAPIDRFLLMSCTAMLLSNNAKNAERYFDQGATQATLKLVLHPASRCEK